MPINRKLLWFIPIIFGVIGVILTPKLAGFTSNWRRIGKPFDNINQIVGIVERKLIVQTDKGQYYSLDLQNMSNPSWTSEENQLWEPETNYYGEEINSWPPPFEVKQLVKTSFAPAPDCSVQLRIGLSQKGELWIWEYSLGCGLIPAGYYSLYCFFPILGLMLGGLLVAFGLGLSKIFTKRK